jgi:hypothetical protein
LASFILSPGGRAVAGSGPRSQPGGAQTFVVTDPSERDLEKSVAWTLEEIEARLKRGSF